MTFHSLAFQTDAVLTDLPEALVKGLGLRSERRTIVERGRTIRGDAQSNNALYLISEGWAISRLSIETGDTQILDILGSGSLAGLEGLTAPYSDDFSITALDDIKLYKIEVDALHAVAAQHDAVSRWFMRVMARQIRTTQRHLTAVGQLPARGRLAYALLRVGEIVQQTGQPAQNATIRLPMTQEDMGNMLGLTNVSISKLMSAFRTEDLIDYGRNRIVIQDMDKLSEICGMTIEAPQENHVAQPLASPPFTLSRLAQ